jgi:glycosyltransferase involved in cell wall biosynthesis
VIAIVIPYYKYSFFEKTLQSLANQTDKRFKVYIGNDCSPDDPQELLEKYKDSFQFEYKSFGNNLGGRSLVKQWDRCLALTQDEEWTIILGDDDTLGENCIQEIYKSLETAKKHNAKIIRFATQVINAEDKFLTDVYVHPEIENSVDFAFRKIKGGTRSSLSEYVFKTSIIRRQGFQDFPLAWHADDLATLEFSGFGIIYTINTAIVYFRKSGINISSKQDDFKPKNIATFSYYYYLLQNKKQYFNDTQIEILRSKLEKSLLNDKKNIYFWSQLFRLYLKGFEFKRIVDALLRAVYQSIAPKNKPQ